MQASLSPRSIRRRCFLGTFVAFVLFASLAAAEKADTEKPVAGSIRVAAPPARADLPALAKISFDQALKAAQAAAPGRILKAELEVEGGCLMYSFEIVTPRHTVVEVEIDAGNGAVLGLDKD